MQNIGQVMDQVLKRLPQAGSSQAIFQSLLSFEPIQRFLNEHSDELTSQMIVNSLSKLNEYKLEYEALTVGKPGQNPGFQPKLFLNAGYIDITYEPTRAYQERQSQLYKKSLIDNRMMSRDVQEASLDKYDINNPQRRLVLEAVTDFLGQVQDDMHLARGMYLTGPFGVGKTYLLGALANALVYLNIDVTMVHYPTLTNEMKALIKSDNGVYIELKKLQRVSVLILDDVGAESNSAWLRDDILSVILESRMKESLPTFFTSNFSMNELEQHLASTREADEPVKAKRLMQRVRYLAKEFYLDGENRRLQGRD